MVNFNVYISYWVVRHLCHPRVRSDLGVNCTVEAGVEAFPKSERTPTRSFFATQLEVRYNVLPISGYPSYNDNRVETRKEWRAW
jgi:hypothetical protein